ncbi:hypothetical protein ACFOND_14495 [Reinekea marina]|uniref:Uncharacterized protein n=1 Tax=Reinekea marina TaxID=1310421 RepID=A0ABV7WUK1_9GAMM
MSSTSHEKMAEMSTEKLYEFTTENDSSDRKWKAMHILEQRRMAPMIDAANRSAVAAKYSAIAAFTSASVAIIALLVTQF